MREMTKKEVMSMLKRILWLGLLATALAACNGVSTTTDDGGGQEEGTTEVPTDVPTDAGCEIECDDGNPCNGVETCNPATLLCDAGTPPEPGTACTPESGGTGACYDGICVPSTCGDGVVDTAEECDDGNPFTGDGCDNDCTFTCTEAADCDDDQVCNGAETCQIDHTCAPGTPASETTACDLPEGGTGHCRAGLCVSATCGNGTTETGEECDDGNAIEGDGCESDCTFTCTLDIQCDDVVACNGTETCDPTTHACAAGTALDDGTLCDVDGNPDTRDVCVGGTCRASICGDAYIDAGATPAEECDDGGTAPGDGCEADCTFTCHDTATDCDDDDLCNGVETCDPTLHVCTATAAPADGTLCDADGLPATRDICVAGACALSVCGDGYIDTGASLAEQCEDGNDVPGDGCDPDDCRYSCMAALDCSDGNACNGAETCNIATHVCGPGTPAADGTSCTPPGGGTGTCRSGECVTAGCGNGVVESGEDCDDGGYVAGDGCEPDCQYTCDTAADCNDSEPCTTDACNTGGTGKLCSNTPLADTTACTPLTPNLCYDHFECVSAVCTGQEPVDCDDGNPCSADRCITSSGLCNHLYFGSPHYADGDLDGYGAGAVNCGVTSHGPEWVHVAGDCCDSLAGVNPGETSWHDTPYACGATSSWDYNCDGEDELRYPSTGRCSFTTCEPTAGWWLSVPDCGVIGTWLYDCDLAPMGRCTTDTVSFQQTCR
jgi:cysteine-rich repeat protein